MTTFFSNRARWMAASNRARLIAAWSTTAAMRALAILARLIFAPAALAAVLGILALAAVVAPAASAQTGAAQCIATYVAPGSTRATIYVSQVVPAPGQAAALNASWAAFVESAYHLEKLGQAICNAFSPDPATQQRVLAAEQNGWARANIQVVQVNWTMGQPGRSRVNPNTNPYADSTPAPGGASNGGAGDGGKDASKDAGAGDAAPPVNQGPPPRASYCYSDTTKPTVYLSAAFDTADLPSNGAWSKAFSSYLAQKYMYKGTIVCKDMPTIMKIQSAVLDQKDTLQGKEVIDTLWTYEAPPPGQAPPPDAASAAAPAPKAKSTKPVARKAQ